jgi:hypothetical protein
MRRGRLRTGSGLRPSYGWVGQMRVTSDNCFDLRLCVPMSREEEHRCAVEYVKTKDPLLAERLIVANMRMVAALARHHGRADHDLRDMIQEGNRGLLRALGTQYLLKELGDDFELPVTARSRPRTTARSMALAPVSS